MLKPINLIIKDSIGNIIYRGNVVTGTVAVDNGDGSYDVFISESDRAYPKIFTLSANPNLAVGDKVRILYENGCRELPIILPPTTATILEGWNLLTATYDNKSKYVRDEENTPYSMRFSSDGTKMYIVGTTSGTVYQYTLGTAWDISTVVYSGKSFLVYNECSFPYGMAFSSGGTKMYILDGYYKKIYQYTLGTAWDISTANYDNKSIIVNDAGTYPFDIYIKSDGAKLYIVGNRNKTVYQYTLGTPYNISTASYDTKFIYTGAEDSYPYDLSFKSDGTQIFIIGSENDSVYHYNIATAWDISTATYDDVSFALSGQSITNPRCIFFKPDGTKMYILNYANYTIYQYSLGSK